MNSLSFPDAIKICLNPDDKLRKIGLECIKDYIKNHLELAVIQLSKFAGGDYSFELKMLSLILLRQIFMNEEYGYFLFVSCNRRNTLKKVLGKLNSLFDCSNVAMRTQFANILFIAYSNYVNTNNDDEENIKDIIISKVNLFITNFNESDNGKLIALRFIRYILKNNEEKQEDLDLEILYSKILNLLQNYCNEINPQKEVVVRETISTLICFVEEGNRNHVVRAFQLLKNVSETVKQKSEDFMEIILKKCYSLCKKYSSILSEQELDFLKEVTIGNIFKYNQNSILISISYNIWIELFKTNNFSEYINKNISDFWTLTQIQLNSNEDFNEYQSNFLTFLFSNIQESTLTTILSYVNNCLQSQIEVERQKALKIYNCCLSSNHKEKISYSVPYIINYLFINEPQGIDEVGAKCLRKIFKSYPGIQVNNEIIISKIIIILLYYCNNLQYNYKILSKVLKAAEIINITNVSNDMINSLLGLIFRLSELFEKELKCLCNKSASGILKNLFANNSTEIIESFYQNVLRPKVSVKEILEIIPLLEQYIINQKFNMDHSQEIYTTTLVSISNLNTNYTYIELSQWIKFLSEFFILGKDFINYNNNNNLFPLFELINKLDTENPLFENIIVMSNIINSFKLLVSLGYDLGKQIKVGKGETYFEKIISTSIAISDLTSEETEEVINLIYELYIIILTKGKNLLSSSYNELIQDAIELMKTFPTNKTLELYSAIKSFFNELNEELPDELIRMKINN